VSAPSPAWKLTAWSEPAPPKELPAVTVSDIGAEVLTCPWASLTVAVRVCVPADSVADEIVQTPCALATPIPSWVVPSNKRTVEPGWATPSNTGFLTFVVLIAPAGPAPSSSPRPGLPGRFALIATVCVPEPRPIGSLVAIDSVSSPSEAAAAL